MSPTRRELLRSVAVLGGALASRALRPWPAQAAIVDVDPTTHVVTGSTSLTTFTVPEGHTLRFDPSADVTLEMTGNLIVYGRLEMKPDDGHIHTLRFVGVDESAYVGDTMDPVDPDIGLWVIDPGVLDILGQVRTPWNRTGIDPTWHPRDEIRVAPTAKGDRGSSGFASFTPGSPVPQASSALPPAEVLNLTRTVSIEGTPQGRAHVFIRSSRPQSIRYAQLRYLGPRRADATAKIGSRTILGRWMLHFHHCGDGSRGSLVEGVVARDGGAHAFVAHGSNGITFSNCIAYNTTEAQYWWDSEMMDDASNDIVYEHCVAALERVGDQDYACNRGFGTQNGSGNKMLGCVATGGQGHNSAAGFMWPEDGGNGTWVIDDCVSHNNTARGFYFWHNTPATPPAPRRVANRFTAYGNVRGVTQGAYTAQHDWVDLVIAGSDIGLEIDAIDIARGNTYLRPRVESCRTGIALRSASRANSKIFEHIVDAVVDDCVRAVDVNCSAVRKFEFVRCVVNGADLEPSMVVRLRNAPAGSVLRAQRRDGTAWHMNLATGALRSIPAFA
jgi:hypothetical protein